MSAVLLALLACQPARTCEVHSDCDSGEMCDAHECEAVTDRSWSIDVVSGRVRPKDLHGHPWDDDKSPPDLYVEFGVRGGGSCQTVPRWDDREPTWGQFCHLYLPEDPVLFVTLWDADPLHDAFVSSWQWAGTDEFTALARSPRGPWFVTGPTPGTSLTLDIWPDDLDVRVASGG
jgi:hypothetical protein